MKKTNSKPSPKKKLRWLVVPKYLKSKTWYKAISSKNGKKSGSAQKKNKLMSKLFWPFTHKYFRFVTMAVIVLTIAGLSWILKDLPSPRNLTTGDNFDVSTQIFDRNGKLLYEIFANENRTPIDIDDLPEYVGQASIAIEDQHFYSHFGFDVTGIVRALVNNLQGKPLEGGSTITQQLVKNALLSPERSIDRKVKEAVLAVFTEVIYSKKDILEMYLNYISYGGTSVGVEAASRRYFDKNAKDLSLAEAALLAGLPQAPSRFSPFGSNPERAKNRQLEVLKRMADENFITQEEADAAGAEKLAFALSKTDIEAPHFVFFVRDLLYETYGIEKVETGGLRVTTTLDLDLHNTAQASVSAEIEKLARYKVSNGAALVLKPNTGEILSMVGSKNYFDDEIDGNVNVTLALRQPGSSIKPIMYATGFQNKVFNPGSVLLDIPTCFTTPGQTPYCPKNYDGSFKSPVTIRRALGNSLNIPAVKALRIIGVQNFMDQATKMGISNWKDASQYGLSLTLGGGEIQMIELAQAFSVLANQGVKVPVSPILKVEDYKGNTLFNLDIEQRLTNLQYLNEYEDQEAGLLTRVMDKAPAYLASHIMQDNNARVEAFGSRSELVIPNQVVSAKTGTTNNLKDNWTVGFTPEFLTITWVGNNDATPMNQYLVSGVTGAAPIWNDIMSFILADKEPVWQQKPIDVKSAQVCVHGLPPQPGENCPLQSTELYWDQSEPSGSKMYTKEIWIKEDTNLPPAYGEQADNLKLESHTIYQDPLTRQYCIDCARPADEEGKTIYEQQIVPHDFEPLRWSSDNNGESSSNQ